MPSTLGHSTKSREPFEDAQQVLASLRPRNGGSLTREDGSAAVGRVFSSVPVSATTAPGRTELGRANTIPSSAPPPRPSKQGAGTMMGISKSAEPPPAPSRASFPSSVITSVKRTVMFGSTETTNTDDVPTLPDEDVTADADQKPPLIDARLLVPLPQNGSTSSQPPAIAIPPERNPVATPKGPPPRARVDLRVVDSPKGNQAPPPNPRVRQPEPPAIGAKSDAVALEIGERLTAVAKQSTLPPQRSVTPQPSRLLTPAQGQRRLTPSDPDEDPNPTHIFEKDVSDELPTLHVPLQAVPPKALLQEMKPVQPVEPARSGSQVPKRDPINHGPANPPFGFPNPPLAKTSQPAIQPGSVQPKRTTTRPPMSSIPDLERQRREHEAEAVETIATCAVDLIYKHAQTIAEHTDASTEALTKVEIILRRRASRIKDAETLGLITEVTSIIYGRLIERNAQPQTSTSVATRLPGMEGSRASALPIVQTPRSSRPPAPIAKEAPIASKAIKTGVSGTERLIKFVISIVFVSVSSYLIWLVLSYTQMSKYGINSTTALVTTSLLIVSIGWYSKKRTIWHSAWFHGILTLGICLAVFTYLVAAYLPPKVAHQPELAMQASQVQTPPQKETPKEETEKPPSKEASKTSAKKSP